MLIWTKENYVFIQSVDIYLMNLLCMHDSELLLFGAISHLDFAEDPRPVWINLWFPPLECTLGLGLVYHRMWRK